MRGAEGALDVGEQRLEICRDLRLEICRGRVWQPRRRFGAAAPSLQRIGSA